MLEATEVVPEYVEINSTGRLTEIPVSKMYIYCDQIPSELVAVLQQYGLYKEKEGASQYGLEIIFPLDFPYDIYAQIQRYCNQEAALTVNERERLIVIAMDGEQIHRDRLAGEAARKDGNGHVEPSEA